MKQIVLAADAPKPGGSYSQAVISNGFVFVSGQIPNDPLTGELIEGDIAAQTERAILNVKSILKAAGASLETVVKTTVFLKNMDNFAQMNEVYSRYFPQNPPARSTIEAARLPRNVNVEIDCIAELMR